jgi:gas vesicle protein
MEMSDNNNDLGAFLAGFVIGGLVGAATALILAPQSGEETRAQIVSRSHDLRQASGERVRHYRDVADTYTHEARERAGQALDNTRNRVQEAGGQVQERARIVLDSGKERASQVREQVNTYVQREDKQDDSSADDDQ